MAKSKNKKVKRQRPAWFIQLLLSFAGAFIAFGNTLNHDFVLDDDVVFARNRLVQQGLDGIWEIWQHSYVYGFIGIDDQSYRPIPLISHAIEVALNGNNPSLPHFINVMLFGCCAFMVMRLFDLLFKQAPNWLAIVVGGLFIIHPIHTEVVANIKSRDELLHFAFFCLTIYQAILWFSNGRKKHLVLTGVCLWLALLCKEVAIGLLVLIPLLGYLLRNEIKQVLLVTSAAVAAFGIYLAMRIRVLTNVTFEEKLTTMNNGLVAAADFTEQLATAFWIQMMYIKLAFFPHPLSWDYSFEAIPIRSFSDVEVWFAVAILSGLAILFAVGIIKRAWYSWFILGYFASLSLVANIFILIGSTLGERFLFTPSLFLVLAFGWAFTKLQNKGYLNGKGLKLLGVFGVIVAAAAIYKTRAQNEIWASNDSLFLSAIEIQPNSSRVQSAYASVFREKGETNPRLTPQERNASFKTAITYYKKAIQILPENSDAWYNLGVCYYSIGNMSEAETSYEKCIAESPRHIDALNNLGVIDFNKKDYVRARERFTKIIEFNPSHIDAKMNMGASYHNEGNLTEALKYYELALELHPTNQNLLRNTIGALNGLGRAPEARVYQQRLR